MKNGFLFLVCSLVIFMMSCGGDKDDATQINSTWVLEEIDDKDVEFSGKAPTLTFNAANGTLTGNGGCNNLNGSVTIKDNTMQFGAISSTKMACPDLQMEGMFLEKINNQPFDWKIDGDELKIYNSSRTLTFEKAS